MNIDFDNIFDHVIPLNTFSLKWRFTNDDPDNLPAQDLEQLKPLDKKASEFLFAYISKIGLHQDYPFKKGFFQAIDKVNIIEGNEKEIKQWLHHCGLAFDSPVFLSWNKENSMIVPWKLLIKYFDSFYYPSSDDLSVIDSSFSWALLFFHANEIYFGTKKGFVPCELKLDLDFFQ
jgi:hypothetical protein